jgi:AcrR family transcriptional regulator
MPTTEERILDAAMRLFARDGLGATTREIARAARVNEVTLFRHFHSKDELLREVVAGWSQRYEIDFEQLRLKTRADFRAGVQRFAETLGRKLTENEDMVRTFIGEVRRHLKLSRRLFMANPQGGRQKFIEYLRAAQKARLIRADIDPVTAADAFSGMLLAGSLRGPLTEPDYDTEHYRETCLQIFLKGVER